MIRTTAHDAEKKISYGILTFTLKGNFIHFGAFKNHIGLYPRPDEPAAFKKELIVYESGKGSIKFPMDKPLPVELIRKIVKLRLAENLKKAGIKSSHRK